jgi:hypothetical protein
MTKPQTYLHKVYVALCSTNGGTKLLVRLQRDVAKVSHYTSADNNSRDPERMSEEFHTREFYQILSSHSDLISTRTEIINALCKDV